MARKSKLTPEQTAKIIQLREEYKIPYKALAFEYGVSAQTIIRICRPDLYTRQKKSNREYQEQNAEVINARRKETYRFYRLAFHVESDAQIIEFLNQQNNIHDYVRQKVLAEINAQNAAQTEEPQTAPTPEN